MSLFTSQDKQNTHRANSSIKLYKELLSGCDELKNIYLKNAKKFENQLEFHEMNEFCYHKLYSEIMSLEQVKPLSNFYEEIPGLKEMQSKAYKYFMLPRNKSVKGMDVQLGNKFDEIFIKFLNAKGIKAERADKKNKQLPDIMILDNTRNIKAYLEHKYHNAPFMLSHKLIGRESYEGSITLDTKKIKKQIIEVESELDGRPVYIIHWVDFHHLKGIFFNTLEQINAYLKNNEIEFERKTKEGDYKIVYQKKIQKGYIEKFYPPLHEMGDFDELLSKLSPHVQRS